MRRVWIATAVVGATGLLVAVVLTAIAAAVGGLRRRRHAERARG